MELIPEWFGTYRGRQARKSVGRALDPDKRYRILKDQIELADTIANRAALAEECLALGRYPEAEENYDVILAKPMGDEPGYLLGKARAVFGGGRFAETVVLLDQLRQRWPDFESAEGHLLYARALEESGRLAEAADEYQDSIDATMPARNPASATAWRCASSAARPTRAKFCPMWSSGSSLRRVTSARPRPSGLPWPGRRLKSDATDFLWGCPAFLIGRIVLCVWQ